MYNRRESLFDLAYDNGIKVFNAQNPDDAQKQGIHLFHPDLDALDDAIERAISQGFPVIYLHTILTWDRQ